MSEEQNIEFWKDFTSRHDLEFFTRNDDDVTRYLAKETLNSFVVYYEQIVNSDQGMNHFKLSIKANPDELAILYRRLKEMPIPFIPEEDDRLSVLISDVKNFLPKLDQLRTSLLSVLGDD